MVRASLPMTKSRPRATSLDLAPNPPSKLREQDPMGAQGHVQPKL